MTSVKKHALELRWYKERKGVGWVGPIPRGIGGRVQHTAYGEKNEGNLAREVKPHDIWWKGPHSSKGGVADAKRREERGLMQEESGENLRGREKGENSDRNLCARGRGRGEKGSLLEKRKERDLEGEGGS